MPTRNSWLKQLMVDARTDELRQAIDRVATPARAQVGKLAEEAIRTAAARFRPLERRIRQSRLARPATRAHASAVRMERT
jgi:hypothetical protein